MANNIGIIIGREFNERVRKKSFIITTLLMPILMIGLMVAPALIMEFSQGEEKNIAVIDESGLILPHLKSNESIRFESSELALEEARTALTNHFAVLYIEPDVLRTNSVRLYANSSTSISLEAEITSQIEQIIETEKLKQYAIDDLEKILELRSWSLEEFKY